LTPSGFVRDMLVASLANDDKADGTHQAVASRTDAGGQVRLSLRMTREQAAATRDAARAAGLAPGAFIAALVSGVPILAAGASRGDHIAALTATNAELATLSRNLHHLASLLRQGAFRAAQEYRPMLECLARDVHDHLDTATRALRELQPARSASPTSHHYQPL
jgi:hypothetical protein